MLKKIHLRLTFLCTGITGCILLCMTFAYLYVAENNLLANSYQSFQNDVKTIISNLENQTIITHEWLAGLEAGEHCIIFIEDNGTPLLYTSLKDTTHDHSALLDEVKVYYHTQFPADTPSPSFSSKHTEFLFSSEQKEAFYVSFAEIPREPGTLNAYILYSCKTISAQILRQRLLFAGIIFLAVGFLFCFSFFFTRLLLANTGQSSQNLHLQTAELDTLVLNCCESFEAMAKEKRITLSVSLPDSALPPCRCDVERLTQVLGILIHNALSYTGDFGIVTLSVTFDNDCYFIKIYDNGTGISREDKKHIFERFYRADSSRRSKGHFGLGLCIAAEIIKAHKGTLRVSDTPGGGSTFTIQLFR